MVEWKRSHDYVEYEDAILEMEAIVADIHNGGPEVVWLLEHPPLYTAGSSSNSKDLLTPDRFPVYDAGRGGQYTYHGPGQRVIYVMLDLNKRGKDIRAFVKSLENWVIATLGHFSIEGRIREGRVGVWVERPEKGRDQFGYVREEKIAAIGIRLKRWVSFHGISINIEPDLEHFEGIVPCGISEYGVTSFVDLGKIVGMNEVDTILMSEFDKYVGQVNED